MHATIRLFFTSLILFALLSPHPAVSTEPLDPPFEGAFIENTTDVNVYGNFREKESLIHDQSSGEVVIIIETEEGCGKKTEVYHSSLSQAESTYSDEVTASDGDTLFSKTFTFDTHPADGSPNIEAERDIGFSPASPMSGIDATEKASLSIGHNLGFTECVEQTQQESLICIKAQNECLGIAAGSAFSATTLSTHSDTAVTVTSTPSLYHHVNASGEGSATAELVFSQTNAATLDITGDCASMDCPAKGGSHLVVFSEKTTANGIFSPFRKDLYATVSESYQTGAQPSFFSGTLTLDTLCPFMP